MGCGAGQGALVVYVAPRDEDVTCAESSARRCPPSASSSLKPVQEDPRFLVRRMRGSAMQACRRLGAELEAMIQESGDGPLPAVPRSADTLLEWDARLEGPKATPYAGGVFRLALWFAEAYPFQPPRAEFITPCYHPNVSERGKICLNVLKEEWSPMLTVSSLLLCISALLSQPNPEDPLNVEAADALVRNPAEFEHTAYEWTRRYAMRDAASALQRKGHFGDPSAADDISRDPLATYQTTSSGCVLNEGQALEWALRSSHNSAPCQPRSVASKPRHRSGSQSTSSSAAHSPMAAGSQSAVSAPRLQAVSRLSQSVDARRRLR